MNVQLSNIIGHVCESSGYLCSVIGQESVADTLQQKHNQTLFHRCTRAYYVYNGCLALYNVVLTHGSTQAWNTGASS